MELRNTFTVDAPIEDAWEVLIDAERVAPCLPGAVLVGREGEDFLGQMKIKLGPIKADFNGKVRYEDKDAEAHRVVLDARGKDAKGLGNAAAKITLALESAEAGTAITVVTDLDISGRVAQFGRNSLEDVSQRMIGQFATSLETMLGGDRAAGDAGGDSGHVVAPDVATGSSVDGGRASGNGASATRPSALSAQSAPSNSNDYFDVGGAALPGSPAVIGAGVAAGLAAIVAVAWAVASRRERTMHRFYCESIHRFTPMKSPF